MQGYLDDLERRKHSSLAKQHGYLVMQRPFFSGTKPCTVYAHPTKGPPRGLVGLPGDIFVQESWSEYSIRYIMDLYDWTCVNSWTRHPEEPNFAYDVNVEELEKEGWFYRPLSDAESREKNDASKSLLEDVRKVWNEETNNDRYKKRGISILESIQNDTLQISSGRFISCASHEESYNANSIITMLATQFEPDTSTPEEYLARLVTPVVDYVPDGQCSLRLHLSFPLSSRMLQYSMPQVDKERGLFRTMWTYCPSGSITPLQMDTFGVGRHVYELGPCETMWMFWPPSRHNMKAMSRLRKGGEPSIENLSKFQNGFFALSSQTDDPSVFYIPPYFIFTTFSMRASGYISVTALNYDVTFPRTIHWMKTEMELLQQGRLLGDHITTRRTFAAFRSTLEGFRSPSYQGHPSQIIPYGLDEFLGLLLAELADKESDCNDEDSNEDSDEMDVD